MNPLFSFIVPVYNVEPFLPKCIKSILGQTYTDFELILVDDGSTDSSGLLCDKYAAKDPRIIVIHKKNERQGIARKIACEHARGEYIVPVDGDDWIHSNLLNHLKDIILKNHPDIVCYAEERRIDEQHLIPFSNLSLKTGYYNRKQIVQQIFPVLIRNEYGKYIVPGVCEKAFKRQLYVPYQTAIDSRLIVAEDAVVTYACIAQAQTLYISSAPYYYYRINPSSTLRKNMKGFPWENPHWVNLYLDQHLKTDYDFTHQRERRLCHALFNIAVSHLLSSRPYGTVKSEILQHLSIPENSFAINNAKFIFPCKDWLARIALKYKLIFLLWLYAKFAKLFIRK